MTLNMQVKQLTDYHAEHHTIQLEVSGGKAGTLKSPLSHEHTWNPAFIIDASHNDNLTFSLFSLTQTRRDIIGSAVLCCPKLVKAYQKSKIGLTLFQYELDLWLEDKRVGGLSMTVVYESGLLFEGEFESQIKLSLRRDKAAVDIFTGKCATKNTFSFMDESATGQYCKCTESIYRDLE